MKEVELFVSSYLQHDRFTLETLPGDAGSRVYYRVSLADSDQSFIVAKYSSLGESLTSFVKISNYLNSLGLNTPNIYHQDVTNKLLLLEDFGKISLQNYLCKNPQKTDKIYKQLIDLLVTLQKQSSEHKIVVPAYETDQMLEDMLLFAKYYLPYKFNIQLTQLQTNRFINIVRDSLRNLQLEPVFSLQDFHTENIMYLNKPALRSFGLIDFQDAKLASPLYDLESILQDARFKISKSLHDQMMQYYAELTNSAIFDILGEYNLVAMQRNCRILGVFARKFLVDNNSHYLQYIPSVEQYLTGNLAHPINQALNNFIREINDESTRSRR